MISLRILPFGGTRAGNISLRTPGWCSASKVSSKATRSYPENCDNPPT